jgi:RND superfamily putative drug exporter
MSATQAKDGTISTRIAKWSIRHSWWAIGLWVAFVVGAVVVGGMFETQEAEDVDYAVGDAKGAEEILATTEFDDPPEEIVLITPDGSWDAGEAEAAAADVAERIGELREVAAVADPIQSAETDALMVPVVMTGDDDTAAANLDPISEQVNAVDQEYADLRVETAGGATLDKGIDEIVEGDLGTAGMLSLPVTLGILLIAFGAFVAAGIPLLLAVTAIVSSMGLWAVASHVFPDNGSVAHVILLIGLAVGVDYSLFYLKREREERRAGRSHIDAVQIAAATSGRAVVVSGLAVMVSLAGMFLTGDAIYSGIAAGCIIVVAVAVLGSLTVLPAVLNKVGRTIDRPRVPVLWRLGNRAGEPRVWPALLRPALRASKVTMGITISALLLLALPAIGMQLKSGDVDSFPQDEAVVETYNRLVDAYPIEGSFHHVVVAAPQDQAEQVRDALTGLNAVTQGDDLYGQGNLDAPETAPDGRVTRLNIAVPYDNEADEARLSLEKLRNGLLPAAMSDVDDVEYGVTGSVAWNVDYVDHQKSKMPLVIAFVVAATFIMMMFAFRSVVVALVSSFLNLLSAAAAFGLLVLVFQNTWAEGILDFQSTGHIVDWIPLLIFVILFGLSMDYHVFVVSRIREAVQAGMATSDAVRFGVTRTAGVVTSAALVMVLVFSIFAVMRVAEMKMLGVGLAAAILIDATIIRILLLPSIMTLLGRANWWPSKLSREPVTHRVKVSLHV